MKLRDISKIDFSTTSKESLERIIVTPREVFFMGGSIKTDLIKTSDDYDKPIGLLRGEMPLEEIQRYRQELVYFPSPFARLLMLGDLFAIGYSPLNPEGTTVHDPVVLGLLDSKTDEVTTYKGRDLTTEVLTALDKFGDERERYIGFELRRAPYRPEGRPSRKEQG